jgi:hypothetical protein
MNIVEKLHQQQELLKEACEILNTLRIDAEMALYRDWDKSDEGFEAQIDKIDDFFFKVDYRAEVYEPEEDEEESGYLTTDEIFISKV